MVCHDACNIIEERIENLTEIPKVDLVINSAAETHVDYSFERPLDFINANIVGLHNLAVNCSKNNIPLYYVSVIFRNDMLLLKLSWFKNKLKKIDSFSEKK